MNPSTLRYRMGPLDRLSINGEHYRPVSTDSDGHVLCKDAAPDHHIRFSHKDVADLHATGALVRDADHFSFAGAQHRQQARSTLLSQISPKRQDDFLHRLRTVNAFLGLERQGEVTRSALGFQKAATLIAAQLQNEEFEADKEEADARASDARAVAEAQDLARPKGSRKGVRRHDSRRPPIERQNRLQAREPVSGRTLASWVGRFEKSGGDPVGLCDGYGNCGSKPNLDPVVEVMIARIIKDEFLTEKRPSIRHCHRLVTSALRIANIERVRDGSPSLTVPSYSAFKTRAKQVPAFTLVRTRHGQETAATKFAMSSGGAGAWLPLQRVETDEWTAHVHLIKGRPVPRSELEHYRGQEVETVRIVVAIVIDCATRYILGLSVAETASSDNAKNALRMAMSDKSAVARAVGAGNEWGPHTGIMEIFSDAGSSFGKTYQIAAMGLGITHSWGPAKQPKLRSTLERFNRTLDQVFLPFFTGRTFSNTVVAGSYNPERRASLTVVDFNNALIRFVVDIYHSTPHEGLHGRTPEMAWRDAIKSYEFPFPPNGDCMRANLGTIYERKVSGEGVHFSNIPYNSSELQQFRLTSGDNQIMIAVDHNDINHISGLFNGKWQTLVSPENRLQGVPLITWRAMQNDMRRRYKAEAAVSSATVFAAIERIQHTSRSAIIDAGLGAIRPSDEEIRRDEGTLRIGWSTPYAPPSSGNLSDQDLLAVGEFIPSMGRTVATHNHRQPSEPARVGASNNSVGDDDSDWFLENGD
ncbi:DDE-type integrase/transposase/recombinase [Aureimonas sp. Leaf324]|uniref:DDE-type integrase/transposase/recombinase n=1 Tax=Aureimonas sp. Leaf324 TaxID=1736336 RepID=UPI000ACF0281|nr:DDE-type integrase/transposase/recombinase [Aureimonas sp. Leaf324]